jgi:long-chain acyl-CoA synthetase
VEISRERHFNRDLKVFLDRPKNLYELLVEAANKFPDKEALEFAEVRMTYKEIIGKVNDLAGNLQKAYGVVKGDRIALLVGNSIEFALLIFAIARIGAIFVPLNIKLKENELAYMLTQSAAKILFVDEEFVGTADRLRSKFDLPVLQYFFLISQDSNVRKNYLPFELLKNSTTPLKTIVNEQDPLFIMYTSGTTGLPKGAKGSHLGVIHSVMSYQQIFKTSTITKTLITIPLFHVSGLIGQLLHMVKVGGTSVIMRNYKTREYMKLVNDKEITFLFNVPAIYVMMMGHPDFTTYNFDKVNTIAYGGAPLPVEVYYSLRFNFPNAFLHNAYGATETQSPTTLMPQHYPPSKVMSVGLPVPVAELKVIDERGQSCLTGEIGELLIKGPMIIEEYWNNDEANQKSFSDGYWCSGDIAMIDEDGFVYIMDRKKDMINRGGEKIYSIEVENILYEHPSILEAAVVGIPDSIFGEIVTAAIVPKVGIKISKEEIKSFLSQRLADYKVPKEIEIVNELPRNSGGKILKNVLKERMSKGE